MSYEIRPSHGGASSLLDFILVLCLVGAFIMVVTVAYIVRCFVKYHKEHTSLWIALAVCVGLSLAAGLVYHFTQFTGSGVLACIGFVVLLITVFVCDVKNRELLQPEKTSLVDQVLHSSWWGQEDKPLETEREQLAA